MKRPWKATKMVKMKASEKSSSTSITRTPMSQVIPITTVREMDTFNQCLFSSTINQSHGQATAIDTGDHGLAIILCHRCHFVPSPYSLYSALAVLSFFMSVHDD